MTDYPITELCKLSKELNHESIDSIVVNLERILLQEEMNKQRGLQCDKSER